MSSFRHGEASDRMAEFKAIVTASFDNIGPNVALDRVPQGILRPNRLVPQVPPSSSSAEKSTRRSPFSFLRKVKSHAASLLGSHAKLEVGPPVPTVPAPPHSFVPSPPRRVPTPIPFASSLPRNRLTRAPRKHHHAPDVPDSGHQNSFFDDDDDDDIVDRRVCPPRRRVTSALAHSNSRLSSTFATTPVIFGLSSQSVSTPYLIAEKNDIVKPEFRPADLAHRPSKPSLGLKLRTKLSLPKLPSPRSQPSSPSIDHSPVTPSYRSHPYSSIFTDFDNTQLCRALLEDRLTTPEDDPFRKDEMAHPFVTSHRLPGSSPRFGSPDDDSDTDKELPGSHPFSMPSSRWSSDSESPPSSLNHTLATGGPGPAACVSNAPLPSSSRSPLSLTFPLPPLPQKSAPIPGITVRVSNPMPGPVPAYPPPLSPPPSGPLPRTPPAGARSKPSARPPKDVSKRGSRRDSEKSMAMSSPTRSGQTQRQRSRVQMDQSSAIPTAQPLEDRSDEAMPTQRKSTRRRDRPVTPFPLLPAGGVRQRQDSTGRLEASNAVTGFAHPCEDSAFDESVDALPDSEVEPDRDFDSDKARKKTSVSSTTSAQTTVSNTSTTSESTTRSLSSVVTALTAATTVSPSTSPNMGADKPRHVSQMLVTDEEGRIVSTATYNPPSPWSASSPSTNVNAPPSEVYVEQGGTPHDPPRDLLLVCGEHVIIGASDWTEFLNYCDTCHDVTVSLAGSSYGNGTADVLVVEIYRAGKACRIELRIVVRTSVPHTSADFPGRIPGSYPLSSDLPPLRPIIPCVSPVDIPQSMRNQWKGGALGLDGVPPLYEAGRFPTLSSSQSDLRPNSHPDCTDQDQVRLRTVLAFTATLPTTLRDLAKRAGQISLGDGVATP